MKRSEPLSFWAEAALRMQSDSVRAALAENEAQGRKPLRRDPPPVPSALIPTDDGLRLRLAEELEYTRRMLELMGDELSNDAAVVTRHMTALQSVDIVGQILGHIANVTRSSDQQLAVDRIGMCELKTRLNRRGGL